MIVKGLNPQTHRQYNKFITILCPAAKRHDRTIDFLNSIQQKTKDHSRVSVVVITDFNLPEDSANIINYVAKNHVSFELYLITRQYDSHLNGSYYNLANLVSESYYSWVLGNDIVIETQDWDQVLYDSLSHTIPQIDQDSRYYYVMINDDTHHHMGKIHSQGSCFPIISNNYSYKNRGPMPNDSAAWGSDIQLYHSIKSNPEFEIIDVINEVAITHYCVHNGKSQRDDVNFGVERK